MADRGFRTSLNRRRAHRRPMILVVGTASIAAAVLAQVPSDAVLRDFKPTADFEVVLGGMVLPYGEVLLSDTAMAYLVIAPEIPSPLLIQPRSGSVESVHLMKVIRREDGSADLLADAGLEPIGPFRIDGAEVIFDYRGEVVKLRPKPPLLGDKSGADIERYDPAYTEKAAAYSPQATPLALLRNRGAAAEVRTFFGSWCPACKRLLPALLRLEKDLDGSAIRFTYYGLPQSLHDDPIVDKLGIRGVPTAVVYVDGDEVGRLRDNDWNAPEVALARLLSHK